jgi:hypothetical protein
VPGDYDSLRQSLTKTKVNDMPVIQLEAQISSAQLLQAIEQMPPEELTGFVERVLMLRAERSATYFNRTESDLLMKINRSIQFDLQERYQTLIDKRRSETLTSEEHTELLQLTEEMERLNTERLTALAELARLRQTSLANLMKNLGIQPPDYV